MILAAAPHHSPQGGKRRAAHGRREHAAEVTVGKPCVRQRNRLVFFVIRRGDPPVGTCIAGIGIPALLRGEGGGGTHRNKRRFVGSGGVDVDGERRRHFTWQSRCFFLVISATSSSSRSCKNWKVGSTLVTPAP